MKWVVAIVPVLGIVVAVSVPLLRYAAKERHERAAIEAVRAVHVAQQDFRRRTHGYATELASLTTPCGQAGATLSPDVITALTAAGYALQLRLADGASVTGRDCAGRPIADAYYVAAAPVSASQAGQQAFAAGRDGRIFLFYDGIPPRESDIASGLATALENRDTFRIP